MALADHAHDDGTECYPGVRRLAWKTGYGERQVRRVLHELRDGQIIEAVAFAHGGTRPTKYALHLDRGVKKSPLAVEATTPDKMSAPPDTATSAPPDTAMSSEPSLTVSQPSGEPSVYKGSWRRTLRAIEGWDEKGEPHMETLHVWIEEKGWTKDQLEASAIGLAATSGKTLKGYRNLVAAFQRRLNQGYDRVHVDGGQLTPDQGVPAAGRSSGWPAQPA